MNEKEKKAVKAWLNDIDSVAYNISPEFEEDAKRIRRLVMATTAIEYLVFNGIEGLENHMVEKYPDDEV